jgi:hypothetical protein
MTSILTSDSPAGQTHELPSNNLLTVRYQTALASAIAPTEVTEVLFVDGVLGTAAGPGTIGAPFQAGQQALNYAATLVVTSIQLRFAPLPNPLSYDAMVIPAGLGAVKMTSWGNITEPYTELLGDITKTGGGALSFQGLTLFMSDITVGNVAVDDLSIDLLDCECAAEISANVLFVNMALSYQSGDLTGTTSTDVTTDGYSWSSLVTDDPTVTPAGYGRTFMDAGHAVYTVALSASGIAIGTKGFDVLSVPGVHVRDGDRVAIQVADPSVQDFICGVHGVGVAGGSVTVWIENLSRVSTDFADDVLLTFHFNSMPEVPPIP